MASQLTSQLKQLLLARDAAGPVLDLQRLSVAAGRVCWRLSLDCVALAAGSPLVDALGAAARLALRDVRVPAAAVAAADAGPDIAVGAADVDVDSDASAAVALDISQLPIIVSACQVRPTTCFCRPPNHMRTHNPLSNAST
jgi:exosome complex RNA-binding protein Rrp42 (RNase PH superfamily)